LLVTGGEDIDPAFYGAEQHPACGPTVPERDQFDKLLFTRALEMNMPVLGICRGIQLINTALGGTLYQDIPSEWDTEIGHRMERPFTRAAHTVNVLPGTPLFELVKKESIEVNSIHHQCIKDLAPGCEVMAKAPDGIIEAIWHPHYRYLRAVQWHPERLLDVTPESNAIFRDFTTACAAD
jgi:putative glutamine amidotransferase